MDYNVPSKFLKFEIGWYRNINFDYEAKLLLDVLNKANKENDVQSYIKENSKWFIPASIFEDYDFGHQEAYIIPEQPLGAEYRADYMLLGRNSIGYQIVFVEFENVNVDYKLKTVNMETESVRRGLVQIKDWKRWLDSNREYFLLSSGLTNISKNIPTWGFHFCLVVSRRNRMDAIANQMRGQTQHETPALHIVTYDRLVDNVKKLSNGF
jgi:hypothetical protein